MRLKISGPEEASEKLIFGSLEAHLGPKIARGLSRAVFCRAWARLGSARSASLLRGLDPSRVPIESAYLMALVVFLSYIYYIFISLREDIYIEREKERERGIYRVYTYRYIYRSRIGRGGTLKDQFKLLSF